MYCFCAVRSYHRSEIGTQERAKRGADHDGDGAFFNESYGNHSPSMAGLLSWRNCRRPIVPNLALPLNRWYKKPIIPLKLHPDAEMPFSLSNRQYIDFTGAFDSALMRLRQHLQWLSSPAGVLQLLEERMADARRDLHRAMDPGQQARIQDEINELERERQPEKLLSGRVTHRGSSFH